jgi:predicted esterase YcpF (UPF0227 family)
MLVRITEVEMKVLYVHGYGSGVGGDENPKVKFLKEAFPHYDIVSMSTKGDYSPHAYASALVEYMAGDFDVVIGSSLGGYWAYVFAELNRIPFILFNPSVDPASQLMPVDASTAHKYEYPITEVGVGMGGMVLLSKHDPVLDASRAKEIFEGRVHVVEYESDDHRMSDPAIFGEDLKEFFTKTVESFHL